MIRATALTAVLALSACAALPPAGPAEADSRPAMRWDFKPQAEVWTSATMDALQEHGAVLPAMVPADYETWCPGYAQRDEADRAAFWAGLVSTLAKHESTWNPQAAGGGGKWFGLVQIAPATARGYGCEARSASALQNGAANLRCAVRIMASTVARDGVVSQGFRGVAADWGPFHSQRKRTDMQEWTRAQPYCQPV